MNNYYSQDEIIEFANQSHSAPSFSLSDYETGIKRKLVETRNEMAGNGYHHAGLLLGGILDRFDKYFYGKTVYIDIEYNQGLPIPR